MRGVTRMKKVWSILFVLLMSVSYQADAKSHKNRKYGASSKIHCAPDPSLTKHAKTVQPKKLHKMRKTAMPVKVCAFWLSSLFGKRKLKNGAHSNHKGVDLAAQKGTPVSAIYSGKVLIAEFDPRGAKGFGNYVVIQHNKKIRTLYAHLDKLSVKVGQRVKTGAQIGTVGNTGHAFGAHLHFEVKECTGNKKTQVCTSVDPLPHLLATAELKDFIQK